MNKNESKYFKSAEKMHNALITLLDSKDFEYITIKEICETAGVNRSTFYLQIRASKFQEYASPFSPLAGIQYALILS